MRTRIFRGYGLSVFRLNSPSEEAAEVTMTKHVFRGYALSAALAMMVVAGSLLILMHD